MTIREPIRVPSTVTLVVWNKVSSPCTMTITNRGGHKSVGKVIHAFRKTCGFPSYSVRGVSYD